MVVLDSKKLFYLIDAHKTASLVIFYAMAFQLGNYTLNTVQSVSADSHSIYLPPPYKTYPKTQTPVGENGTTSGGTTVASNSPASPVWPLQGKITTRFGVPHSPWQKRHTGIDISSGQRSGKANLAAYREGVVTDVVRSSKSLGNHVIIDHGEGLTTLYGHLYSSNVVKGQQVKAGDIIGREGSTGVSTGTHLHFEMRLHGEPVNPKKYLNGPPSAP